MKYLVKIGDKMVNLNVKINVISEEFSVDDLLDLIKWKLEEFQAEFDGKIWLSLAGYEVDVVDQ